ncbi:hypothetical protein CEP48_05140 [Mergibacter septicus]|uniref:DUF4376 domain-containing protein n=1 Tax=Mergibacter septicus TaxID=221402 RepID=A0A8E3MGP9_9PAST|nr:DUF4376 domain-containing protein [Mergibacter septicus]AWX15594.1 hypothetical protein CEP47_05140 [Mergibacter septicus]QDJ14848.1 hypothetical protein CEP48_05140 [Mergibacter septicus]UTU47724.1 DUF4376 domain-containing protein [Mergibacter septicus]WMR96669.1 DUF4376 domain-containing protein [Mergibacter septicus]
MNKNYLIILDESGKRITSLVVGIHADTLEALIEFAKQNYSDFSYIEADETLQNQLLDTQVVYQNGKVVKLEVDREVLKAEQQNAIRNQINALRDKKTAGGVYVQQIDKWIDTDDKAQRNLSNIKSSFDLFGEQEIYWTCADNDTIPINKQKLISMWAAIMSVIQQNHANAIKHKTAMLAAENPLEYDYSTGWTTTYDEFLEQEKAKLKAVENE